MPGEIAVAPPRSGAKPRWVAVSAGALIAIGLAFWLWPSRRIAPEHHLAGEDLLPAAARGAIHQKMQRHGLTEENLVWQVVLLDYDGAAQSAREIQAEPMLARPLTGDATELNSRLPEEFFALQEQLRARTTELARAAERHDPTATADAFAACTRTCVGCHQIYLAPH